MIESYYGAVRRFLKARLRGSDWAEDLTQETFARALASGGALDDSRAGSRQAWLFQIASNLAVDFSRRERVRSGIVEADAAIDAVADDRYDDASRRDGDKARLIAAIDALPPKRRDVLILHKLEGYSHAEIAERLGMSRAAVEKNVVRALADLRETLTAGDR